MTLEWPRVGNTKVSQLGCRETFQREAQKVKDEAGAPVSNPPQRRLGAEDLGHPPARCDHDKGRTFQLQGSGTVLGVVWAGEWSGVGCVSLPKAAVVAAELEHSRERVDTGPSIRSKVKFWKFHCGLVEMNPTNIHEDARSEEHYYST